MNNVAEVLESKISTNGWKAGVLFNADVSCFRNFVEEIIKKDKSGECKDPTVIEEGYNRLLTFLNANTEDALVTTINSVCISSIRKLSYSQIEKLFAILASSKEIKEAKEVAILRLMSAIPSANYSDFFNLFEKDNNKILINLVKEMDDKSIYPWDGNNYTNFIGGLVLMFKENTTAALSKLPEEGSESLLASVFNLDPQPFKSDIKVSAYAPLLPLNQMRYFGTYDATTGKITIKREQKVWPNNYGTGISVPVWANDGSVFEDLSPLTPIIITASNQLPLIQTALMPSAIDNSNVYIVPAIFLKYQGDKNFNDAVEKTAMITLDAITIAASGGTALATKVTWARRIWAMIEVAGAAGNIAMNLDAIDPNSNLGKALNFYNVSMAIIGVKNVGKGVVNFAKNLPEQTKNLLKNNGNIRTLLQERYQQFKASIASAKNETEFASLDETAKQKVLDQEKLFDELMGVQGAGNLAKYTKIRSYLGDGRIKAYLNNQQLLDFENLIKTANDDVLKVMDEFKSADEFAEMIRGYKDNPTGFTSAIKTIETFNGSQGWLKFWRLTPRMENSLNTIAQLKNGNKIANVGNATDIQLSSIHAYTANGDFINVPYRYNPTWFGEYNTRAIQHINEGLNELRKIPSRKIIDQTVFSGKTFSKTDFESKFLGKMNTTHSYNGYMSTSKLESVAEGFIDLTKQWAIGSGEKIAVIQRVTSKNGVYIDDISDWGRNLGKTNHPDPKFINVQIQEEVLLNSQKLKQISEPIPVMVNGIHKTIDGMKVYYVDFLEIL